MPQNPTNITESPEFKEFCKKNNLEVFNQEAINIVLLKLFLDSKDTIEVFKHYEDRVTKLEEENKKLREMINEIAKNVTYTERVETEYTGTVRVGNLFDKWNKNEH